MTNAEREAATASALVAEAQAGEPRAFDALVKRYRKRIFALALHIAGSAAEADDITQEVFLKAYRALPQFEGRSQFFTWVYRMTVNRSINARRDRARRGMDTLDEARVELAVKVDARDNPRLAAELRQTYARLLTALDSLPAEMSTTVILVALQGLSHGEVAVITKVSEGTIAWRMHEARRRLHDAMAPEKLHRRGELSEALRRVLTEHGLPLLMFPAPKLGR